MAGHLVKGSENVRCQTVKISSVSVCDFINVKSIVVIILMCLLFYFSSNRRSRKTVVDEVCNNIGNLLCFMYIHNTYPIVE